MHISWLIVMLFRMARFAKTKQTFSILSDPKLLGGGAADVSTYFGMLIKPGGEPELQELGWLGLAKLYRIADEEIAKPLNHSVLNLLSYASGQDATFGTLHFARAAIERFPWLKSAGSKPLDLLCKRFLNFIRYKRTDDFVKITAEFYAFYTKDSSCPDLLEQLRMALGCSTMSSEKNNNAPHFFSEESHEYISTVFLFHGNVLKSASSHCVVSVEGWLEAASEALRLNVKAINEQVFAWIEALLNSAGTGGLLLSHYFVSLFLDFCRPSKAYYNAVQALINIGLPSKADRFCKVLLNPPATPLHSQDFGEAYANAVSALLIKRHYLLEVPDLIDFQGLVCAEAYCHPDSLPALKLLKALLTMNHDLVPTPVQIAQSIFAVSNHMEAREGLAICTCISRPRLKSLISYEIYSRSMRRLGLLANSNGLKTSVLTEPASSQSKPLDVEITKSNTILEPDELQIVSQEPVDTVKDRCNAAEKVDGTLSGNYKSSIVVIDEDEVESHKTSDHLVAMKRMLSTTTTDTNCDPVKRVRFKEIIEASTGSGKTAEEHKASAKNERSHASNECESPDIEIVDDIIIIEGDEDPSTKKASMVSSHSNSGNQTQNTKSNELTVAEMMADFNPA